MANLGNNNDNNFVICTFNCNGIHDRSKRKDTFDYLRTLNYQIYMLQETHINTKEENYIRSQWGYNIWVSGVENNKNGVAILFNNNFEYKVHGVSRDPNGCFIALDVEFLKKRITLVNIYAPSRGDHPEYFEDIIKLFEEVGNDHIIIGGDWNCALDLKLDTRNYSSCSNRPLTRKKYMISWEVLTCVIYLEKITRKHVYIHGENSIVLNKHGLIIFL